MQEIKKRRIVIASVLKPIDDTRMFEKLGESLTKFYDVHIAGYPSASTIPSSTIFFHVHKRFARLSLDRVLTPWRVLWLTLKIQPKVLVITTHELLWISAIAKLLTRCRIIYDIQENYYSNLMYTNAFPLGVRQLLAWYVRIKEFLLNPLINQFWLAERCYREELPFVKSKMVVLENKFKRPNHFKVNRKATRDYHLLFTGTLAESTGVFLAVDLARQLHARHSSVRLTIAGYSAQPGVQLKLKELTARNTFITLIGGDVLVPHAKILQAIEQSDFGIISYPQNKSTENCIPTKLYEYLACQLPMLMINNTLWIERCVPYPACIAVDFHCPDVDAILEQMKHSFFYRHVPNDVWWENEEHRLLESINYVLS